MKNFVSRLHQRFLLQCLSATVVLAAGTSSLLAASNAQGLQARVRAEVTTSSMRKLPGSVSPMAQASRDSGRLQGATRLEGITLFFSRTEAQQKDLEALIKAQGDKSSPLFHKWLTPEQFGARFGLADADIAKVQAWLESQGFQIDSVARGKGSIRFSGAASQVEATFATELHNYNFTVDGKHETHFAPASDLSVPSALAEVVLGVRNLDDFKPRSMRKAPTTEAIAKLANPQFTSGSSGNHYLSPGDIATIYGVNAWTQKGYTGVGQTIAIMGQSAVDLNDIAAFQSAAGLTAKAPTTLLVPGTGASTIYAGDESESDLDLEWSGALATGAEILFVYTGNSANSNGIFDSMQYAVDNKLAQIISVSYGLCEYDLTLKGTSTSNATILEQITSQAATQGQTIVVSSGDSGSTACFNTNSTDTLADQQQLNVSYPASSPYVTAIGGSEFSEGNTTGGTTYWDSNGSNDVISSAKSYIPEMVWNDDSASGLAATGGGISVIFAKPSWQTGVTGIPTASARYVPDISLASSNNHDPYLYCTSDSSAWSTSAGQVSSCTSGFRDSTSGLVTVAGGTSFATPVFAGMLALINDGYSFGEGQGLINPTLYSLAAVPATYSTAFHDVTSGSNACVGGSSLCSTAGKSGYSAGAGYDLATGLGTIDLNTIATAWTAPSTTPIVITTTTTVSATNNAPNVSTNVTFTATVASAFGATTPTGTVTFTLDGTYGTLSGTGSTGTALGTQTLSSSGVASLTTSFTVTGSHVVLVRYSGDATHGASTGIVALTIGGTSSGSGSFTLTSAGNITASRGSSGSTTITVTPAGGYKGTVQFSLTTATAGLDNACYTINNATVTGTAAVTTSLSINTNAASCASAGVTKGTGTAQRIGAKRIQASGWAGVGGPIAAAGLMLGLLLAGIAGRKSRKLQLLAGVILLATFGFAFTGCGGGSGGGSSSPSNPAKGTYNLTVIGTDSTTSSITSSVPVTLTIN